MHIGPLCTVMAVFETSRGRKPTCSIAIERNMIRPTRWAFLFPMRSSSSTQRLEWVCRPKVVTKKVSSGPAGIFVANRATGKHSRAFRGSSRRAEPNAIVQQARQVVGLEIQTGHGGAASASSRYRFRVRHCAPGARRPFLDFSFLPMMRAIILNHPPSPACCRHQDFTSTEPGKDAV